MIRYTGCVIVYFLRHGSAERQSSGGDRARKLTEKGQAEVRQVLAVAKRAGVQPELVISSPYVRAIETATLAMKELELEGSPSLAGELVPESTVADLWSEVRAQRADSVLVVSHEPLLSSTVAWAVGSTKEMVHFPPAGLVAIEFESASAESSGVLRWMIAPEVC